MHLPFYPPVPVNHGEAKMHDGSVICLPPPPTPDRTRYIPSTSAKTAELISAANLVLTEVVFTPDGRFHRMVTLNRKERRSIRLFEPGIDTHDLESAKRLIRHHLNNDRVSMVNVGLTLKQIRDERLFLQGGFESFATWLKVESTEIGLSSERCYELLSVAEALDRFLITTFMGTWKMSVEDVLKRMKKLSRFMTGIYRHKTLEELKGLFIAEGSPKMFVDFVMDRPATTPEDDARKRAVRGQKKKAAQKLKTTSPLEQEIVDAIRQHLDVVIVGLNDLKDAQYIKMALLANRRQESDLLFKLRKNHFSESDEIPAGPLELGTLEDAKAMLLFHQAEGIPHRLVCAVVCALLADDPELVRQWRALEYESVHTFINIEFDTPFDSYRYVEIGRNYLCWPPWSRPLLLLFKL